MSAEERLRHALAPDEEGARERALLRLRAEWARRGAEGGAEWARREAEGGAERPRREAEGGAEPPRRGADGSRRRGRGWTAGAAGRGRARGRLAAAVAAAAVVLAAGLTPPGEAVADWVRAAVGLRPEIHLPTDGTPRSDRPPSGGRLLVAASGSLWIVEPSGERHRLGAWTAASWSPHGRFVIAWKGRRLAALDRRGHVRWSLQAPRPVTQALWSPSGFRVAYRAGGELRVVAGDGTGDRPIGASFSPIAWRPGRAHVLAHTSGSHLDVIDVDSGLRLARIQLPFVSGQIAWSADGTRLYARLHRSIAVYDARGRRTGRIRMPGRRTVTSFVPARAGHLVAVSRREHVVSEVALMGDKRDDVLFRADGRFTRLRFSPDGRWLLAAWPLADQWVFLRSGAAGASRVITSANVSRRFEVRGFPQLEGWCCPP
jgi:hypothetical protein